MPLLFEKDPPFALINDVRVLFLDGPWNLIMKNLDQQNAPTIYRFVLISVSLGGSNKSPLDISESVNTSLSDSGNDSLETPLEPDNEKLGSTKKRVASGLFANRIIWLKERK